MPEKKSKKLKETSVREDLKNSVNTIFDRASTSDTKYYNRYGNEDNKENAVALVIKINKNEIYKILQDKNKKLYNPLLESNSYGIKKTDRFTKEKLFKFAETNKKCFDLYLGFLKTNYDSYLSKAEREI